jgi:hypothetical protein
MELLHGLFPRHCHPSVLPEWPTKEFCLSFPAFSFFYFHCKFQVLFVYGRIERDTASSDGGGEKGCGTFSSESSFYPLVLCLHWNWLCWKVSLLFLCHFLLCHFLQRNLPIRKYLSLFHIPFFFFFLYFSFSPFPMGNHPSVHSNNLTYQTFNYPQGLDPVSNT